MKQRILFLAANPPVPTAGATSERALEHLLGEEARAIGREIQLASQRDAFEFVTRWAVQPLDLLGLLREIRPTIVHFAGHADADGFYLTRASGAPAPVTGSVLTQMFGAAGSSVQVVVLNRCITEPLAEALCEFVPIAVGTSAAVPDEGARAFSLGFYGALASSESVANAFLQGKAAMGLDRSGDPRFLRLHRRHGVDPTAIVLVSKESIAVHAAIEAYRTRKQDAFEDWDLRNAGPHPMAGRRPLGITLDDMYIPLRFHGQLNVLVPERGKPIEPEDLLHPPRAQVLVGGAGSGKTTWMRWTFRKLIGNPQVLPFFLELRAIAASWKTTHDAARAFDGYLADELTRCQIPDSAAVVAALLRDPVGPQPVVLIDGWDELGAQGERVRERLVEFCNAFPNVVVMVSSRPYGDIPPPSARRFQTLYIQPLSDRDVRRLATNFHRCVHGLDEAAEQQATDDFMAALTAAPGARGLAGTALLLTMILLLSREGPLPDRRHKLYTACLRNMMLHRVMRREREGAVQDPDQWRPPDSEELLRVVAELAFKLQTTGYELADRRPVIQSWDAALRLLSIEGSEERRGGFLRWLIESAGVLVDRADGSIQFAHLSFQEYLAAYHMFITLEGEQRVTEVRHRIAKLDWWETLRLWAGLTGDHGPDKLRPVLQMLCVDREGYWLAGEIFADGTGSASDMDAWTAELVTRLSNPFGAGDDCARAWAVSRQGERREQLIATLASVRGQLNWLAASWHAYWCSLANLAVDPAPALQALEMPLDGPHAVARSRVLFGAVPSWPDGNELAVLRLWPSARATVGARLQAAISVGATPADLAVALPALLPGAPSNTKLGFAQDAVRDLDDYFTRYLGRDIGGDSVRNLDQYVHWHLARRYEQYLDREVAREFGRTFRRDFIQKAVRVAIRSFSWEYVRNHAWDIGRYFARQFAGAFVDYFIKRFGTWLVGKFGRDSFGAFVRDLARRFDCDLARADELPDRAWVPSFAILEAGSIVGRAAPRAVLAYGNVTVKIPLLKLFRHACAASFNPGSRVLSDTVVQSCEDFHDDPLWPALARHVSRISTTADRQLLEDLASHPEQRPGRLSWGLQHYVRGDLVLDGGQVLTLDELCAQAGMQPLPFLEAMPDELDIPLGPIAP